MDRIITYFSPDYATARDRFRQMTATASGRLESLPIDAKGPHGESLTIDIAWFGASRPKRAILHSSGLHGVEGFAGSAIQLQLLDAVPALPDDMALVITHVLNPFGMAWLRRVNEANVDLNRNCLEGEPYKGAPATYGQCDSFLNPASPPSHDFYILKAQRLILKHGMTALKQSIAGGQYEFPRGLFFGGKTLQPEIAHYRAFLARNLDSASRIVAIDVHTGVGKYGEDLLLVVPAQYETMRRILGDHVCSLEPDRGAAYRVRGGLQSMIFGVFQGKQVFFVGQEFGTFSPVKVVHALREENRWHQFGAGTMEHRTKSRIRQTFIPDDEAWRRAVLKQGRELITKAVDIAVRPDAYAPPR